MTEKDKKEIFETVNEILAYLDAIRTITVSDVAMREFSVKCCKKILQILKKDNEENNLPRPIIRDGKGKLLKDYTPQDFYLIFEGIEQHFWFKSILADEGYSAGANCQRNFFAEEIASIITVLISFLNAIGYDEKGRSELFAKVNAENEKRGYFEEGKTEKTATTKIFSEKEIKSCVERLQDLVRDRQSFLTGEADHDEVFLKDIHFLEMAMTLLELKGV